MADEISMLGSPLSQQISGTDTTNFQRTRFGQQIPIGIYIVILASGFASANVNHPKRKG
jgi:hypothetical protein